MCLDVGGEIKVLCGKQDTKSPLCLFDLDENPQGRVSSSDSGRLVLAGAWSPTLA